ncbi:hypothetical protein Tco_0617296 [Tanacetum coccineum]
MDWLSRHRAKIICHERVVRIPLPHGEMIRVYGEWPEEKVKRLMRLPPSREVEFCIDLIHGAMSVVKYPYLLAPTKMEELSNQLKELQDKGLFDQVLRHDEHRYSTTMTEKFATTLSSIKGMILAAQNEASEVVDAPTEMLRGLDEQMKRSSDGEL